MAITASIIGTTFVTLMINGTTHTVNADHPNYTALKDALRQRDHALAERLVNIRTVVEDFGGGAVRVVGNQVFYQDNEIKGSVVDRILQMVREGFDAGPMMNFLDNLMKNPSKRAVDELYLFLEATNLPITPDGCFLAYKKVREDYRDFYTGKIPHRPANRMSKAELAEFPGTFGRVTVSIEDGNTTLSMSRNHVDDNRDRTCSDGLHFCSLSYLPEYHGGEGRVMILKINPAHVVSIPSDYKNAKGRAERYQIAGERTDKETETTDHFTSPVYSANKGTITPVLPKATTVTPAPKTSKTLNPALVGYNRGRSDASKNRPHNHSDARFAGMDANRYLVAYNKGYLSVRPGNSSPGPNTVSIARDGYQDGYADAKNGKSFAPAGSKGYIALYQQGWLAAKTEGMD